MFRPPKPPPKEAAAAETGSTSGDLHCNHDGPRRLFFSFFACIGIGDELPHPNITRTLKRMLPAQIEQEFRTLTDMHWVPSLNFQPGASPAAPLRPHVVAEAIKAHSPAYVGIEGLTCLDISGIIWECAVGGVRCLEFFDIQGFSMESDSSDASFCLKNMYQNAPGETLELISFVECDVPRDLVVDMVGLYRGLSTPESNLRFLYVCKNKTPLTTLPDGSRDLEIAGMIETNPGESVRLIID